MASSSPQRFYDYLDCLQQEFERWSNEPSTKDLSPRRFKIYLGNLKGEFELMSLELEYLQRDRDQYKEKVDAQAKELQSVCHCKGMTTARGILASPQLNILNAGSSFPPKSLEKYGKYGRWEGVTQNSTPRLSTRRMTLIGKLQSAITRTTRRPSNHTVTHSQTDALPSPASTLTVDPESGVEQRNCSTFNSKSEMELDVEIAHTLFHEKLISCVNFSQDGKYVAAGCFNGSAYIYDVESGASTCVLRNLLAGKDLIRAVCFSPDGKYLATGLWVGVVYIWEITTKYVRNAFKGHTHCINSLNFSPNGRLLVSASDDNTVRLWSMRYGAVKTLTENSPTSLDDPWYTSITFSPDGLYVAASHNDGMVRMWSVRTGQLMRRVKAHTHCVFDIAFMSDGMSLVSGGWDSSLRFWDVSSLYNTRCTRLQTMKDSREGDPGVEIGPDREFSHEDSVISLAVSPDGRWIASGSYDKGLHIWGTHNAATQCILNDDRTWTVDFSPAGRYFASGSSCILRIWRYTTLAS